MSERALGKKLLHNSHIWAPDLPAILSLSPLLTAIFQVNHRQQVLLKLRVMEEVVTNGVISGAKLQSNHHHQHPMFYRPDALPVAQPTV